MDEHQACIAALAGLPGATCHRLGRLLSADDPPAAWRRVVDSGVAASVAPGAVLDAWAAHASAVELEVLSDRLLDVGVAASCWHDEAHPGPLRADVDPAPILLRVGRSLADGPRVGVIGTRRCTSVGREIAFELGAALADAGVTVVSGLALGIDGAAHRGALSEGGPPPVAVVGSGPDVVYPRRHHDLWHDVARRGSLFTEVPLGGAPEPWRFPARNRLLAALSDVLVVVESRAAGGSLLTVEQACRRDVPVMAVPGSLRNPAAAGTNQLLADGCAPVRDVTDVLVALGLSAAATSARRRGEPVAAPDAQLPTPDIGTEANRVFDAVDDGPTALDALVRRSGLPVPAVLAAVDELVRHRLLDTDGARYTRAGRVAPSPP